MLRRRNKTTAELYVSLERYAADRGMTVEEFQNCLDNKTLHGTPFRDTAFRTDWLLRILQAKDKNAEFYKLIDEESKNIPARFRTKIILEIVEALEDDLDPKIVKTIKVALGLI
jgi:hypothetical protein